MLTAAILFYLTMQFANSHEYQGKYGQSSGYFELSALPENFNSTAELLMSVIPHDATVAVVGPNRTVLDDPTLAFALHYVTHGHVYVIEPQSDSHGNAITVIGSGGWDSYRRDIQQLQSRGVTLSESEWCGIDIGVQNMDAAIAQGTVQTIIDHGTAQYLARVTDSAREPITYDTIFSQYARALAPGGSLVLALQDTLLTDESHRDVVRAVEQSGLVSRTFKLQTDSVAIPITAEAAAALSIPLPAVSPLDTDFSSSVKGSPAAPYLDIGCSWFNCRTVIVAQK